MIGVCFCLTCQWPVTWENMITEQKIVCVLFNKNKKTLSKHIGELIAVVLLV